MEGKEWFTTRDVKRAFSGISETDNINFIVNTSMTKLIKYNRLIKRPVNPEDYKDQWPRPRWEYSINLEKIKMVEERNKEKEAMKESKMSKGEIWLLARSVTNNKDKNKTRS